MNNIQKKIHKQRMPRKVLVQNIENLKEGSVLELGGGVGNEAIFLAEKGFDVTNVDANIEIMEKFETRAEELGLDFEIHAMPVEKFNFEKTYDNIISFFTLHFVGRDNASKLLSNMIEHTSEGGLHILQSFTNVGEFDQSATERNFYPKGNEILEFYIENNMEIVHYHKEVGNTASGKNQEKYTLIAKKL